MNEPRAVCLGLFALAAIVLFFYANQQDGKDRPIPAVQGEAQMLGMGVKAGIELPALGINQGTPLDLRPEIHFWAPGFPGAGLLDENVKTVKTAHRYPAVPGGNVSTVIHKGWSSMWNDAPADNDWRLNPPEVAVL